MRKVALVVDDSMLMRYSLCRFFEDHGFAVESATNGVEALEVLARVQPDLIVTDMQMQKMSGSELITALKDNPKTVNVPIIVVASKAAGNSESENRANFVVCKDIDIETQLSKALDALTAKAGRTHAGVK
ncbi:MAG TPA: response regulator [Candidatus Sulfotelmatobacter sp.]|jgi:CheY-like chemotaxis protein